MRNEIEPYFIKPIKQFLNYNPEPFIELINETLEIEKLGEETADPENKIDTMVYRLYDLTAQLSKAEKNSKIFL